MPGEDEMHQSGCAPLPRAVAVAKAGGRQTRHAVPRFIADVYLCRLPHLSEMQTVSFALSLISALGKYDDGVVMSHRSRLVLAARLDLVYSPSAV